MAVGTKGNHVLHCVWAALSKRLHMMDLKVWVAVSRNKWSRIFAQRAFPAGVVQGPGSDFRRSTKSCRVVYVS
jgi:hypothetical protein